ncbi:BppU family phage baseplate upper protein [Lactococcus petauri]|uniref:BppU family phage baseplate upper protein n=1 Tax=Lactococcus petauri TaxID=1940789 RepID=A0ABZ2SF59_9LACT|nr:BppU family phage baseplate upper protein [Lactococcus petauri]OAL09706.1 prophage Lp1 protein 54 [Lactococcus garvieae]MCV5951959.1 BppU family phage baseplate upper protein [Lactococcus petauri]MCV5966500.1 BppU family phage baseplate upper protein [Lactococcus petauri]MCV5969446.1 BppU family phage baseplate upper protein [Lactococcus petauri]MCV5979814.1 BppU family phage baseplate upper protein [Lactococcus petauri]
MANKIFNLDLTKDTKINSIVLGRVGDGGLQTITVNISNRDVPVDLTGFTITFEGVTNSSQSKIFDSYGVKTETEKLKQGQFDYTFPSAAFSVAGRYETAYFSFQKDENRDTTGKIDIFVSENADIDAGEAESIITEYNKLVQELHEITDKYISDSDAKFSDINNKISELQLKITQYQNTVKDTADGAIKAVDDALKKFEAGDFYTKSETDAKFKVVNDLVISQDIPEGSNLDDYKKEGEFSKKTPTVVTGAPEGVSGAFRLSVRSMVGSSGIFQTLYDYATRGIYYRVGNTSLGFNLPWQRIANNSEVVHLTGDETIEGKKTFTEDLKANSLEVSGDLPKGNLTAKTGFAINGNAWYRVKNGLLQISCTGLSITANVPTGGWKDVCSLTGADSINSTGDATTVIMNGNNASYIGARVRVVNGVLRILPEAAVAPTQYMNDFITIAID